jgi:hypothetical protein|tara:strand:- start:48 stop:479 length:432 start_codon:yes stop_codon:yes gene_type:complete
MVNKEQFHIGYEKLCNYTVSRLKYEIVEGPDEVDACHRDTKQIAICSRMGIENKLYTLLHECGHALIRENLGNFAKEYTAQMEADGDGRKMRSARYKVETIEEEIEAWKRGRKLASRLEIELNEDKFNAHKTECLMTYIRWAG